nr:MAG TPA: hypothetical protein [Caudoviricetes sp.]
MQFIGIGKDGFEPSKPSLRPGRSPVTSTFRITRKPRVSNMFIVLCFPLGNFS